MRKPEPKVEREVCTVCGLDWQAHGLKPTLETCIGLLKSELAKRPRYLQGAGFSSGVYPFAIGGGGGGGQVAARHAARPP